MLSIVSSGSLDIEMYFGCIVKSIIYIAVSLMESPVQLVFLVADYMVTDFKRNLFFGKFWIFCLLFLFCFFFVGGVAVI